MVAAFLFQVLFSCRRIKTINPLCKNCSTKIAEICQATSIQIKLMLLQLFVSQLHLFFLNSWHAYNLSVAEGTRCTWLKSSTKSLFQLSMSSGGHMPKISFSRRRSCNENWNVWAFSYQIAIWMTLFGGEAIWEMFKSTRHTALNFFYLLLPWLLKPFTTGTGQFDLQLSAAWNSENTDEIITCFVSFFLVKQHAFLIL